MDDFCDGGVGGRDDGVDGCDGGCDGGVGGCDGGCNSGVGGCDGDDSGSIDDVGRVIHVKLHLILKVVGKEMMDVVLIVMVSEVDG